MKNLVLSVSLLFAALAGAADAQQAADGPPKPAAPGVLEIQRYKPVESAAGSPNFTGSVKAESMFRRSAPARASGGVVTFQPGARTAWHVHPLGQTLIVTAGCGWVQVEGGPVQTIRTGDVALIPPGVRHWHGASATTSMTHVAVTEVFEGRTTDWAEPVTDEQYRRGAAATPPC